VKVLIGLDYGRKRIGVAVSTPLGTVHPRARIDRTTREEDMEALKALARDAGAAGFVVGLPHHMDGRSSEMEVEVRQFAMVLAVETGLPVYGTDERLTSESAESILLAQDRSIREMKARRDSAAACILLQDFVGAGGDGERIA